MTRSHTAADCPAEIAAEQAGLAARIVAAVRGARANVRRRRELRELLDQPDHVLADIGVDRLDLAQSLTGFWFRPPRRR